MPQITDIRPQKSSKRFNIFIDGRFALGLDEETLVKACLRIGQEITEEEIQKLASEDEFVRVYERALRFFSYRPRSEKELRDWFIRKQIGEQTQNLVFQKLGKLGYLNDEEFAKWWVDQRTSFRPTGARLLAMELRQKGISKEIVSRLTYHLSRVSERELAKKVMEKKLKTLKSLPPQKMREKLTVALLRRGFSWETIKNEVDEILKKE